jgi:hypothetical protein
MRLMVWLVGAVRRPAVASSGSSVVDPGVIGPMGRGVGVEGVVGERLQVETLLIDAQFWENLTAPELLQMMQQIHPSDMGGVNVASYKGEDLYMAQPLEKEAMEELYMPPFSPSIYAQGECFLMRRNCNCNCICPRQNSFRPGWDFRQRRHGWTWWGPTWSSGAAYIARGGYSEYMHDWEMRVPAVRRENVIIRTRHTTVNSSRLLRWLPCWGWGPLRG